MNEFYEMDANRVVEYGTPGVLTRDGFDCSMAATNGGWWKIYEGGSRDLGGLYQGVRRGSVDLWTNVKVVEASATHNFAMAGINEAGSDGAFLLFGNYERGPQVSSVLNVSSEVPASVFSSGKFWCLDGPSGFRGGQFVVCGFLPVGGK